MFEDTRPAQLDSSDCSDSGDRFAQFRVSHAGERLALMRQLRDSGVPVILSTPEGCSLKTTLWAMDDERGRLNFSVDLRHPLLEDLVQADELVAVAYLESLKLQFDPGNLVLVRGFNACALQGQMPREIYRFQRRNAYRVRAQERYAPTAYFRHPSIPDMPLALRVLDLSVGGCALWLPGDTPGLQGGTRLSEVSVVLDDVTRFAAALTLQHVTELQASHRGARLGCAWQPLSAAAERSLHQWIDQAQRRQRLLGASLGVN